MKKILNKIYAIVPSAGIGSRFEYQAPKQYFEVDGISILEKTLKHFIDLNIFQKIIVPINNEDYFFEKLKISEHKKILKVDGGNTRSESVMSALNSIKENSFVVIHDAVRPFINKHEIYPLLFFIIHGSLVSHLMINSTHPRILYTISFDCIIYIQYIYKTYMEKVEENVENGIQMNEIRKGEKNS